LVLTSTRIAYRIYHQPKANKIIRPKKTDGLLVFDYSHSE